MVHASLRAMGPVEGGAEVVLDALEQAVGPEGTLLMVVGSSSPWHTPGDEWDEGQPFDSAHTPAHPEMGWLAEVFRCRQGTHVTDHPIARFAAWGRRAKWLLQDAPWHDYFGPGSPLERLCAVHGRVLRLGADLNTVTLLHWAEYLVPTPDKRRVRRQVLVRGGQGNEIRNVDSLDDSDGIVEWKGPDYFALILDAYLRTGRAREDHFGMAMSELLEANELVQFAVEWMMDHFGLV